MHPRQVYWAFSDHYQKENPKNIPAFVKMCSGACKDLDISLLPHPDLFISIYGGIQNILEKNFIPEEYNSIVKLSNDYVSFSPHVKRFGQAEKIIQFQKNVTQVGASFVYIQCPHKIYKYQNNLPRGMKDNINPFCDILLSQLQTAGVDYIDSREIFRDTPQLHYENYFRADHHWKERYPFSVCSRLAHFMSIKKIAFKKQLLDMSKYNKVQFHLAPSEFIRVGQYYVTPDSDTKNIYMIGVESGISSYDSSKENKFLSKPNLTTITSKNYEGLEYYYNPEGLGTIVFICDSYGEQITYILSLNFQHVYRVDPRVFKEPIINLVLETLPDIVILMYWPESLSMTKCFENF